MYALPYLPKEMPGGRAGGPHFASGPSNRFPPTKGICLYVCACVCICVYVHTYIYIYIYIYMYVYVCMYIYIYIYIYYPFILPHSPNDTQLAK